MMSRSVEIARLLGALFAFAGLASSGNCQPAGGAKGSGVNAAAQSVALAREDVIAMAAQVVRGSAQLARIWPTYWPEDQAFIIQIRDQGALLISSASIAPPTGFEVLSAASIPPELRGRAFFHSGSLEGTTAPFITDFPLGNGRTAMFANAGSSAEQTLLLLIHEQFHAYQRTAFRSNGTGSQFINPLAIRDRTRFAAGADIERRVLRAAIASSSPEERTGLLRQYFALRRAREATVPAAVVGVEEGFERSEGTAKYVDRVAHAVLLEHSPALPSLLMENFDQDLTSDQSGFNGAFATTWFRSRSYGTGAALCYLLSLYDPQNWRSKIEQGAKLDVLLESFVGKTPATEAALLASQARAKFGYEARRRQLAPIIRAQEATEIKSVAEFMALAPFRMVLELKVPVVNGKRAAATGLKARGLVQLSPSEMAVPQAISYSLTMPGVLLAVRERPILLGGDDLDPDLDRSTVLLAAAPRIGGRVLTPGQYHLDTLIVSAEGYDLKIDGPVVVVVTRNEVRVRRVAP
jgi:hypothetical protein